MPDGEIRHYGFGHNVGDESDAPPRIAGKADWAAKILCCRESNMLYWESPVADDVGVLCFSRALLLAGHVSAFGFTSHDQ